MVHAAAGELRRRALVALPTGRGKIRLVSTGLRVPRGSHVVETVTACAVGDPASPVAPARPWKLPSKSLTTVAGRRYVSASTTEPWHRLHVAHATCRTAVGECGAVAGWIRWPPARHCWKSPIRAASKSWPTFSRATPSLCFRVQRQPFATGAARRFPRVSAISNLRPSRRYRRWDSSNSGSRSSWTLSARGPAAVGNGLHVKVDIVWKGTDVLTVPSTALFREGEGWAVYVAQDGRAHLKRVTVGRADDSRSVIESGLVLDDEVILQPSDAIRHGTRVASMP